MPESARAKWKPSLATYVGGAGSLVLLIIAIVTGGIGSFLMMVALLALGTSIYVAATGRPSWLNLPRSRRLGWVIIGGSVVVLILGSSVYGAMNPTAPRAAVVASASSSIQTAPTLTDFTAASEATAFKSLQSSGYRVVVVDAHGATPADVVGWTVQAQDPPAGQALEKGGVVTLTVVPPVARSTPTPTPTASPTPTAVPAPVPVVAPPAQVVAPPAVPVAPPAQQSGTITPGAFCSSSQVGQVGVASNGRSYTCGGHGADASGHYHWNTQ